MSVKINYQKTESASDAFIKVKTLITPQYIEKFQVKAKINYDEQNNIVMAKGSGFTLSLVFFEKNCTIDLELSFLLRAFKAKILEKIENEIRKNL